MSRQKESYAEKIELLIRALRQPRFRFIIISFNHYDIRRHIENLLKSSFPERGISVFDMEKYAPLDFYKKIFAEPKGIKLLDNFQVLLADDDFSHGFNQRRDRFSRHPIQFIAFIPPGNDIISMIAKKIPDMWSLRNLLLDLHTVPAKQGELLVAEPEIATNYIIGKQRQFHRKKELREIEERINSVIDKNPVLALNLFEQAVALAEKTGDFSHGLELTENWLALALKNYDNNSIKIADIISKKAKFLRLLGKYEEAKSLSEKALSIATSKQDENKIAEFQNNLALVLQDLGDYQGAKVLLEKATKSAEKNFGKDHPTTAVSYSNLALVLKDLGDYQGAKELLEKATKSDEKNFGKDHPTTAMSYSNLATVLKALGDYQGALDLAHRALDIFKKTLPEGHPYIKTEKEIIAGIKANMK